jgi:hypothetical protein
MAQLIENWWFPNFLENMLHFVYKCYYYIMMFVFVLCLVSNVVYISLVYILCSSVFFSNNFVFSITVFLFYSYYLCKFKFALRVETVLNTIPQPEYKQLMVEALIVLTMVAENDWTVKMDVIHVDRRYLTPTQNIFSYIWWREQVIFQWDDDKIRFLLDQHT